jgi:hypothetical protein
MLVFLNMRGKRKYVETMHYLFAAPARKAGWLGTGLLVVGTDKSL